MFKPVIAILALSLCFSGRAFAADEKSEGSSSVKIEDVNGKKNKVEGDIDEEITNAKLRAESGSKSKWSLSNTETYSGGALSSPFAAERPNLSGLPGQQRSSSLQGALNGRYRASKNNSFTAGGSFAVNTPFQGDINTGKQTNILDPSVAFNHVEKVGPLQTVATVAYAYGTSNESQGIDLTHQFGVSFNTMHAFDNGLSVGALLGADYNVYTSKPGLSGVPDITTAAYGHDKRTAWDFAIYPEAEYRLTDRYSMRTVFGYFNWVHKYGDPVKSRLLHQFSYQSVGVGIAVTRDIFLYPNIQFVPDNIRSDFTNVAMSATINVF